MSKLILEHDFFESSSIILPRIYLKVECRMSSAGQRVTPQLSNGRDCTQENKLSCVKYIILTYDIYPYMIWINIYNYCIKYLKLINWSGQHQNLFMFLENAAYPIIVSKCSNKPVFGDSLFVEYNYHYNKLFLFTVHFYSNCDNHRRDCSCQ